MTREDTETLEAGVRKAGEAAAALAAAFRRAGEQALTGLATTRHRNKPRR